MLARLPYLGIINVAFYISVLYK